MKLLPTLQQLCIFIGNMYFKHRTEFDRISGFHIRVEQRKAEPPGGYFVSNKSFLLNSEAVTCCC